MDVLILGGTKFVGRHITEAARAAGHRLTLFHRGQTNPDLFPDVETITGDRNEDLGPLAGRRWDAIIDTCGYFPRQVESVVDVLGDAIDHYVFLSSGSAYADLSRPGLTEDSATHAAPDPPTEEVIPETYGPLKAECERVLAELLPGHAAIVRAGLIVGPWDHTDRFTYWPVRIARGGRVVAPGARERPVQFVDGRDLAQWIVAGLTDRRLGTFNATGPAARLEFGTFIEECRRVAGVDAELVWVSDDVLERHGVAPFAGLPLWLPSSGGLDGLLAMNCTKAIESGLRFRPLEETIRDTLEWHGRHGATELAAGLTDSTESAILGGSDA